MKNWKKHIEPNQKVKRIEQVALIILLVGAVVAGFMGATNIFKSVGSAQYIGEVLMERDTS